MGLNLRSLRVRTAERWGQPVKDLVQARECGLGPVECCHQEGDVMGMGSWEDVSGAECSGLEGV